jgi:threonine/homoserine/homoserine lactone efflux protein
MQNMLGPLALFALTMCFTPGPNVVMITASSANFGFPRAIPHMLGISFGFGAMAMAAGLGLAGLFHAEPRLHVVLKYVGAAYLLYLAWRIAHAAATSGAAQRARPIGFVEATLFTRVNPRAWVSVIGAPAAFTSASDDMLLQTSVITAVLSAARLASCRVWAAFGVAIGRYLGSPAPVRSSTGRWPASWCCR